MQRTLTSKLADSRSVKDFGAVGDGVTDDTLAFNAAIAATQDDWPIQVPPGKYNITGVTSTRKIVWQAWGAFAADGVTPLSSRSD